jgi:hypothetical protein
MTTKEALPNKILMIIVGAVVVAIIGWGTWITVAAFEIEDVRICATKNEVTIEKKAVSLQRQINTRMDKQEKKLDKIEDEQKKMNEILIRIDERGRRNEVR